MTQYRCDSCTEIKNENELTFVGNDSRGQPWYRCNKCIKKWGTEPRSIGLQPFRQIDGVMGFEDPNKVIGYGPKKRVKR